MEEIIKLIDIKVPGAGIGIYILWYVGKKLFVYIKTSVNNYKQMKKQHEYLMSIMESVAKELKPNGGSSIKDSISNIELNLNLLWEKQKTVMAVQGIAVFESTPSGQCTYVNRHYCELSGLTQEEALGNGWINAVHPLDRDKVYNEWASAISQKREFKMKYKFMINDNDINEVMCHASPIKDKHGNIISYLGKISSTNQLSEVLK